MRDWPAARVVDVAPRGGTLVVFDARLLHEVRPARRARRALTLWVAQPVDDGARGEHWDTGYEVEDPEIDVALLARTIAALPEPMSGS